jgi:hypothetical protein
LKRVLLFFFCLSLAYLPSPTPSNAWFDETPVAMAKVTGYPKCFNVVGPDMIRLKMGTREGHNHFVNNPRGTIVTPDTVIGQAPKYNTIDPAGHLYGAIIGSVRAYIEDKQEGKYAEYHLAFCAHYVAHLSHPCITFSIMPSTRNTIGTSMGS